MQCAVHAEFGPRTLIRVANERWIATVEAFLGHATELTVDSGAPGNFRVQYPENEAIRKRGWQTVTDCRIHPSAPLGPKPPTELFKEPHPRAYEPHASCGKFSWDILG